ncbi:MAG: hypothetical protein BGO05_16660 [Rhizobiales bacterium 63-7]|nr:MAG: hypothetical protein BGO05_16660 [Rhizobiales bacterium 63-7]
MALIPFTQHDGSEIFISTEHVIYVKQYTETVWVGLSVPSSNGHPYVIYLQGSADEIRKKINSHSS